MRTLTEGTLSTLSRRAAAAAATAFFVLSALGGIVHAQPDLSGIEEQIVVVRAFDLVGMALGDISGLAVGSGLVVTNAQMLRGAETFVVVVSDGAQEFTAEIRSLDERSGVAILEAERLSTTGARFALDDPDEDPEQGDVVYVPRFAGDGSLDDLTARGLIAEVRRLEPDLQGERALLLYRHNAAITAREYGMPMLNDCGDVIGLIRPDPDMSLRDLNDRSDPGESTFGVAGAEIRRALATLDTEVETAETPCLDANATVEQQEERARQLEDDAQLARDAADAARREAEEAREQAREAQTRAAALEADAAVSEAERDAAREAAETLLAAAKEKEAELDDLEQRADAAREQARVADQRVARLERERRLFSAALVAGGVLLLAVGFMSWRLLRRRGRQLAEAEAARSETDEKLAAAVTPASFSCLLEGTDENGRSVVIKIDAAQLGLPDGVIVGRNPAQAGVVFDHPEASREHFRLTARGGNLSIENLNSTNGTFVNGTALLTGQATELSPGDEIGIGAAIRMKLSVDRDVP